MAALIAAIPLTAAIPLIAAIPLTIPGLAGYFATWLLPGLALTVATLILLTWLTAWAASAMTSAGWIVAASIAAGHGTIAAVASAAGRAGSAVVVVVLAALLVRAGTVQRTRGVLR